MKKIWNYCLKIIFIIVEKDWVWRRRVNMAASAAETRKSKMKSASYGDTVIETFKELKQNDELCDFTVSAEGKSIKVQYKFIHTDSIHYATMFCKFEGQKFWWTGLVSFSTQIMLEFITSRLRSTTGR